MPRIKSKWPYNGEKMLRRVREELGETEPAPMQEDCKQPEPKRFIPDPAKTWKSR